MRRKPFLILLGVEAALLLALSLLTVSAPEIFSSALAFPFEQIGAGLRALSTLGGVWNGLALALWGGLSLLPLIPALRHWRDRARRGEACALCCLSLLLFVALYYMANPAELSALFHGSGEELLPITRAIIGGTVWSAAVLWAVLRLLRLFRSGSTGKLLGYLKTLLYLLCALFTGIIAASCGGALITSLRAAQNVADGFMSVLRFAAAALPYALDIAVALSALSLLDLLISGQDGTGAADRLSRLCCVSLGASAASVTVLNITQLLLAGALSDVSASLEIPFMSIAFVLAALLFSRLIAENRRLRDDNDLFI